MNSPARILLLSLVQEHLLSPLAQMVLEYLRGCRCVSWERIDGQWKWTPSPIQQFTMCYIPRGFITQRPTTHAHFVVSCLCSTQVRFHESKDFQTIQTFNLTLSEPLVLSCISSNLIHDILSAHRDVDLSDTKDVFIFNHAHTFCRSHTKWARIENLNGDVLAICEASSNTSDTALIRQYIDTVSGIVLLGLNMVALIDSEVGTEQVWDRQCGWITTTHLRVIHDVQLCPHATPTRTLVSLGIEGATRDICLLVHDSADESLFLERIQRIPLNRAHDVSKRKKTSQHKRNNNNQKQKAKKQKRQ